MSHGHLMPVANLCRVAVVAFYSKRPSFMQVFHWADLSVTKEILRVGSNVYIVG